MSRSSQLIVLFIAGLLAGGCGPFNEGAEAKKKESEEKKEDKKKERGVPVEVTTISRGKIEEVIKASNHLEAEEEVKVHSRAANLVTELLVEEGDVVKKDQVLVRLEDTDQRLTYKKTLGQLIQATNNFARTEKLHADGLVPQKEYDDEKAQIKQLELNLEEAERQVNFTEVRATIGGTITARMVKLGDNVNRGQHLFDIIDFDSIVARVYVAESHLKNLEIDQPVRLIAKSLADQVFEGYVKRIAPIVDKNSGTVKVTLGVRNRGPLRPGMYVDAELVIATHPEALLIPKRAIVYGGDQMFVYRLMPERRVKRILVESLLSDRDNVEPKGGFEEGEEIVIAGQTGLRDDALIRLPGDPDPEDEEEDDKEKKDEETTVASTNAPPDKRDSDGE